MGSKGYLVLNFSTCSRNCKRRLKPRILLPRLRYLAFLFKHGEILGNQFHIPETAAGLFLHGLRSLLVGESRLVGTCGAERVVNVDNLQDSREHRNLRGEQPIGIAGAVRVFMMMPDDRKNEPERVQRLADVLSCDGMELHNLPFGGGEVGPFLQNLVRDGNLAEIVQVAAALERNDGILVHAEMTPKFGGVNRKALAVALSVWVAAFDDQSKRAQHRVGGR